MQSKAATVKEYLAGLPADRRAAVEAVRKVVLANLDKEFEEGMQYGMIGWYVPHRVFPAGYHCDPRQPLPFAALASQKNHLSLYVMSLYGSGEHEREFRREWARSGKKLDMGKCCIRFKRLEDLSLEAVAGAFRRVTARGYVAQYLAGREGGSGRGAAPKRKPAAASKPARKRAAARKPAASRKPVPRKPAARRG